MGDVSGIFPAGSRARVVKKTKTPPSWLGEIGTVYTIDYCLDCGPDVVWLVDCCGQVQTIDGTTLLEYFVLVEPSDESAG
jgi:hypothetical protein